MWERLGKRRFAIAAVAAASLAAPAGARSAEAPGPTAGAEAAAFKTPKLLNSRGRALPGPYARWLSRSLVPMVSGPIRVYLGGCPYDPRLGGCVYSKRLRSIYLDGRLGGAQRRAVIFHELGHLYDFRVMNERERLSFKRIFRTRRSWWRSSPKVAEWFSEAYSWCARYPRIRDIRAFAFYDYDPTPAQHERACALIRRAGAPGSALPQPPIEAPAVTIDPPPPPQPPARETPESPPPPPPSEGQPPPEDDPEPVVPLPPILPFPPLR